MRNISRERCAAGRSDMLLFMQAQLQFNKRVTRIDGTHIKFELNLLNSLLLESPSWTQYTNYSRSTQNLVHSIYGHSQRIKWEEKQQQTNIIIRSFRNGNEWKKWMCYFPFSRTPNIGQLFMKQLRANLLFYLIPNTEEKKIYVSIYMVRQTRENGGETRSGSQRMETGWE